MEEHRHRTHAFEHRPGAAGAPLPAGYRPRSPETTVLHKLVSEHIETMFAEACARTAHGFGLPRFVERTFLRYHGCGILARG